jgi:hypothetical protein
VLSYDTSLNTPCDYKIYLDLQVQREPCLVSISNLTLIAVVLDSTMLPGAIERIFAFVNGPTGKHGPQRQVKSGGYDRCYDPAENQIR